MDSENKRLPIHCRIALERVLQGAGRFGQPGFPESEGSSDPSEKGFRFLAELLWRGSGTGAGALASPNGALGSGGHVVGSGYMPCALKHVPGQQKR